jgi:ketosteroid isomerase-like protein
MTDRLDVLREIAVGFDTHDLDRIMRHFTDDAVFEGPRGVATCGSRFVGIEAIRDVSEWTLRGTTVDAQRLEVRGCDLWTFDGDRVVKKDSFWKIRTG